MRVKICSSAQTVQQQPRGYAPATYQNEPLIHEVDSGQQSAGGLCLNVCMPTCEPQCIQRSTPVPVVPQHNSPIPVVQSQAGSLLQFLFFFYTNFSKIPKFQLKYHLFSLQTAFYYPSEQNEPAVQQYSDNDNTVCIHLCMPSCESQCIEQRTPGIPSYTGQTEQPNGIYYPKPTPYSPSSYQNFIQANQTSLIIRPQQYSGAATICIPICMPACELHCTENQGQSSGEGEYISGTTQEPTASTKADLLPHEISISLPQSIQQSPDCMNLCQETCMQQCVGQSIIPFLFIYFFPYLKIKIESFYINRFVPITKTV